jgi:hypothetical protein
MKTSVKGLISATPAYEFSYDDLDAAVAELRRILAGAVGAS